MALVRAYLTAGDLRLTLPVNPYSANWSYRNNTSSTDTLGGRVVQLLSVQVTDMTVTSVAGSRQELQKVADGVKSIMNYHVQSSLPARFVVPSRAWNFSVFIRAMPQIGWDVSATTYPYQLVMAIAEDITGVKTRQVTRAALGRLAEGIGYIPSVHGGNTAAFIELVDTVLKMAPEVAASEGGDVLGEGGSIVIGPDDTLSGIMAKAAQDRRAQNAGVDENWVTDSKLWYIIAHESGVGPQAKGEDIGRGATAQNPTSTAYGIFQFLDSTWGGTGIAKTSDPYLQCVAGLIYIKRHWGTLERAYDHKVATGWY